jgi:hypothetical protein
MPYKNPICGIYCITAPSGSQYVGSSHNIKNRWSEHRSALRRGDHHSVRLQHAWNKHGKRIAFSVLEECPPALLNQKEQEWMDRFRPVLNITRFVDNVWVNPQTRAKLAAVHQSTQWREARRAIALRTAEKRRRPVECSNGTLYPSMTEAALAFGIKASGIDHLTRTQRVGRLGVRFKFADEEWRHVPSIGETLRLTRLANGTNRHTEETRALMRANRKGWRPTELAKAKSLEASSQPVIATSIETGEEICFPSQRDAARAVRPENIKTAGSQINKACYGVKRSAYGYTWRVGVAHAE